PWIRTGGSTPRARSSKIGWCSILASYGAIVRRKSTIQSGFFVILSIVVNLIVKTGPRDCGISPNTADYFLGVGIIALKEIICKRKRGAVAAHGMFGFAVSGKDAVLAK